jgi:hypothetical protein
MLSLIVIDVAHTDWRIFIDVQSVIMTSVVMLKVGAPFQMFKRILSPLD